jgi:hypothetical protein
MLTLNSGALGSALGGIGIASELINAESAEIGLTIRKPFTVCASGTASHQGSRLFAPLGGGRRLHARFVFIIYRGQPPQYSLTAGPFGIPVKTSQGR